jgi:2,3-dihydroxybiphenyl 1,2-dioxygenase
MDITALTYVGVHSAKLDDWADFATRLLGMQAVDRARGVRAFRMDERAQRLVVENNAAEGVAYIGFEAADAAALARVAARVEAAGVAVERGARALADERRVADLIVFRDPGGHRIEVCRGVLDAAEPFVPGRCISGFRTGPLGMGHAVLHVENVDILLPFYRDVLGFGVSDYGLRPYGLYFFHVNQRHHSLAMVGSGRRGFHHFMVELYSLDDVGQGYDLALLEPERIAYTLGRHTNDYMMSYYLHTPSGFFVEYGWGGRSIDPATWQPHETTDGPSLWGHERPFMPVEQRERLRAMRLDAARRGLRQPAQVIAGNYEVNPGACPWADSLFRNR